MTCVTLDRTGRILIPAAFRKKLGLNLGTRLILRLRNERFELVTAARAVKDAQKLVQRRLPAKSKLADELIQARRKEAANE
ncbi:MAG: AbrB/MazE/SpoVT family DNA-binding domain-containing protein [Candidatus Obscuribacterales bacterium]|nr:AbrB/MazE/SpoVT family DNA-binding domain-containing protein [Steroidobacteraceae bacterium]